MKKLLSVIELGGYEDFSSLYQELGYEVTQEITTRKAISRLKRTSYDVVVAEFNYQHTFRDRLSNLESIIACLLYTSPSPRDVEESRMPSSA